MLEDDEGTKEIKVEPIASKSQARRSLRLLYLIPLAFLAAAFVLSLAYAALLRPLMTKPISEKLDDMVSPQRATVEAFHQEEDSEEKEVLKTQISFPSHLAQPPLYKEIETSLDNEPQDTVCSYSSSKVFLLVGIDAKVDSYQGGLADVIRLVRVDFANRQINMIALPRDMMIDFPEGRSTMESPMKINQAYTIGTPAMQKYVGGGNGAHSLAEAIDYNFGVKVDHYMVVNFQLVRSVIDSVGGVDVYLPQEVEDDYFGYYPSGYQHLDGLEALVLMRIRMKYNDAFRVANQTIVLKAMLDKMKRPEMILRFPKLVTDFKNNVITDLSVEQIVKLGRCLSSEFDSEKINAKQFTPDHITAAREFIPSTNLYLFVYKWGDEAVKFIHDTLSGK